MGAASRCAGNTLVELARCDCRTARRFLSSISGCSGYGPGAEKSRLSVHSAAVAATKSEKYSPKRGGAEMTVKKADLEIAAT
jgi:hypothetical protein